MLGAIAVAIAAEPALSSRWKAKVRRPLFLRLTRLLPQVFYILGGVEVSATAPHPPRLISSAPMQAERHHDLAAIARRAMRDHGLEPDFPPAALAEAERLTPRPPRPATRPIRDLRDLLWSSIDNDDSRDLDQLEVAEALAGGAIQVLVAIADVDALVAAGLGDRRPRAAQHDLGLHRRAASSRCSPSGCRPTSPRSTRARTGWRS